MHMPWEKDFKGGSTEDAIPTSTTSVQTCQIKESWLGSRNRKEVAEINEAVTKAKNSDKRISNNNTREAIEEFGQIYGLGRRVRHRR